ncbi:EPOR protein, partial [Polyodon spathula]|nr:EPOR protein [Polyodon spathula]
MRVTAMHKLSLLFCVLTSSSALDSQYRNTGSKAALLLAVERKDPKCFTESLKDLTCFWDETLPPEGLPNRTFDYRYESEDSGVCNLTVQKLASNQSRFLCEFPEAILFAQLDVTVRVNDLILHHRSLSADQVYFPSMPQGCVLIAVLLDPPMNLSVRQTGKPGQLHMKWLPPSLKYMDDSIIYEVGFSVAGSELRKTEVIKGGRTDCVLMKLKPLTRYVVSVRAKPDGITYNGYWSAWSEPVTAETPTDLDPLILALSLILLLIMTVLFVTVFLSHRRFLLKKMWPRIPSPEGTFGGLFTVHRGNFQTLFATSESSIRSGISSDSERQSPVERTSSGSSFDYAVYDPSGDLLFPSKHQSYPYLRVADSGISVDYSPMGSGSSALTSHTGIGIYTNLYKNDICHHSDQLPHSSGAFCSGY